MGDDAPPAFLSRQPRPLWDYCKQRFAQVTNPPIDPLRETHVMSCACYLGERAVLTRRCSMPASWINSRKSFRSDAWI